MLVCPIFARMFPPLGVDEHYIVDRAFELQFDPVVGTLYRYNAI